MDTLADPRSEVIQSLAVEVLRRFGEARLRVTGSSMLGAMWPGILSPFGAREWGNSSRNSGAVCPRWPLLRPQGGWEDPPAGPHAARHARRPAEGKRSARFSGGAAGPRYRRHSRLQVSGPGFHGLAPHRASALVPLGAGHADGTAAWLPVEIH